jgi:hypothetical protein
MAQLTAEERRRIFLNRQHMHREMLARPSAPVAASETLGVRQRLGRMVQVTLIAALLGAGWLVSHAVVLHVPASLADMLPRL